MKQQVNDDGADGIPVTGQIYFYQKDTMVSSWLVYYHENPIQLPNYNGYPNL